MNTLFKEGFVKQERWFCGYTQVPVFHQPMTILPIDFHSTVITFVLLYGSITMMSMHWLVFQLLISYHCWFWLNYCLNNVVSGICVKLIIAINERIMKHIISLWTRNNFSAGAAGPDYVVVVRHTYAHCR